MITDGNNSAVVVDKITAVRGEHDVIAIVMPRFKLCDPLILCEGRHFGGIGIPIPSCSRPDAARLFLFKLTPIFKSDGAVALGDLCRCARGVSCFIVHVGIADVNAQNIVDVGKCRERHKRHHHAQCKENGQQF